MTQKNHYHMIAGEIVFQDPSSELPVAIRANGVLIDPGKEIPIRLLGKAQQILQINFHQKMEGVEVKVLDVVLINFMYLGHMTAEQFQKVPEGMKMQERPAPVADLETAVAQAVRPLKSIPAANADTNEA